MSDADSPIRRDHMKSNAVATALLLALFVSVPGCGDPDEDIASSKSEVAEDADASGKADQVDICSSYDWYDDDFCDDPYGWCAQPDPDCGADGDSCGEASTWSGRADEGCVLEQSSEALAFTEPQVIGSRSLASAEGRAWAGVAVDREGDVHVAYVNISHRPVYSMLSEGWEPHVLGDANTFVRSGLTIDADAAAHVAYVGGDFRLNHLVLEGGQVVGGEVSDPHVYSIGLALGSEEAHFVFGSGDRTAHLSARSGSFAETTPRRIVSLDNVTEAPENPAVVTDERGWVHTVYGTKPVAFNINSSSQLRYASRDPSGVWTDELVARADRSGGALAVSRDGVVTAVYPAFAEGQQTLMLSERVDSGWETRPLFGVGASGRSPAIAASADGTLHVVYRSNASVVEYTARRPDGEWSPAQPLDVSAKMSTSDRISVDIGPDASLHIVYTDSETRDVRYIVGR